MEKYCNTFTSKLLAKGLTYLFMRELSRTDTKRNDLAMIRAPPKNPTLDEWMLWLGIMISPIYNEAGVYITTKTISSFFKHEKMPMNDIEDEGFVLIPKE